MNNLRLKLKQIAAITKKNMKIYYLQPPVLIFGVLFPFFLILAFTQGRGIVISELLPGLLGIIFFFTGSSVAPFITPWETRTRILERLLCSPISISVLVLGDVMGGFIFGLMIAGLILLLGVVVFGITITNLFLLILTAFLSAFCFASLGTLFAALPTANPSQVMMLANLVRLPIIFVSGVFIPVGELPFWGRMVAPLSPVTYVTDLMRHLIGQGYYFGVFFDLLMLAGFNLLFFMLAILIHKKTMLKRI